MERGLPCPSVLRPQGRRKGIPLDPEIFGIEGHPEGDKGGEVINIQNNTKNRPLMEYRFFRHNRQVKMRSSLWFDISTKACR